MWAAIGVMLRVYVQRQRAIVFDAPLFEDDESAADTLTDQVSEQEQVAWS